jgi:hypothetical protein
VAGEVAARLGPPLVCVPVEIGTAKSLPWREGAFGEAKGYRTGNLVNDTLGVLKTSDDVLVHMETLRRATVYIGDDAELARELLARLAWIAMDFESAAGDGERSTGGQAASGTGSTGGQAASGTGDAERRARAWFDAGYLAAALGQMDVRLEWKPGVGAGVQGYAWLRRAVELSDGDPAMHFAAGIAAHPGMRQSKRDLFEEHIRAAIAGAGSDSLLMRNLEAHLGHWEESVAALRGKP